MNGSSSRLGEIETLTRQFGEAYDSLGAEVGVLTERMEAAKREHLPRLKGLVRAVAERKAKLAAAIDAAAELFVRPRTLVCHGIKVGLQKGKGTLAFDDAETLCTRIAKIYAGDQEKVASLVTLKSVPNRTALAELPASELRRLGVTIEGAGDQVVIKPTDGEVEKVVSALLRESEDGQGK